MPKYKSDKIVDGYVIDGIADYGDIEHEAPTKLFVADKVDPVTITAKDFARIFAMAEDKGGVIGGVLVVYEDDYVSWCPYDVFMSGHTELNESEAAPLPGEQLQGMGYRELSKDQLNNVDAIQQHGRVLAGLIETMRQNDQLDQRWVSIGATDLQTGLMALKRAVTKPDFF